MRYAGLTLAETLRLATTNPARFMDIPDAAAFTSGAPANLIRADWDPEGLRLTIAETVAHGEVLYRASSRTS